MEAFCGCWRGLCLWLRNRLFAGIIWRTISVGSNEVAGAAVTERVRSSYGWTASSRQCWRTRRQQSRWARPRISVSCCDKRSWR